MFYKKNCVFVRFLRINLNLLIYSGSFCARLGSFPLRLHFENAAQWAGACYCLTAITIYLIRKPKQERYETAQRKS